MVQRDGCWIRQTEKFPKRVTEEIGPCARKEPTWVEDRLTRLVQECVAASDHRWQVRALAAFNRGEPLPPQDSEKSVLESCMKESTRTLLTEHEAMKVRIGELSAEREQLRTDVTAGAEHLRASHDKLGEALGEAAKKPAPSAVATATARGDGTATTNSDLQSQTSSDLQSQTSHASDLQSQSSQSSDQQLPPDRKVNVRVGQTNHGAPAKGALADAKTKNAPNSGDCALPDPVKAPEPQAEVRDDPAAKPQEEK